MPAGRGQETTIDLELCPSETDYLFALITMTSIMGYEKALLERSGYAVLTAPTAQPALRLVTMCKCDAALLDHDMFAMSSCDAAFEIKLDKTATEDRPSLRKRRTHAVVGVS
jgi:hypothetical protein